MCGLYGIVSYGKKARNHSELVERLGKGAAQRGTHATGVSYVNAKRELVIDKAAVSAYKFKGFNKIPSTVSVVMGHTRHTTQGSEKKNYNNHPFLGSSNKKEFFALAHNGVLDNDLALQRSLNLPKTEIETDSYVAVQLLEQYKKLNLDSVKGMAEQVEGMFTFTVLDNKDNLYIIKNDSPMNIIHFPHLELYAYASTVDILHDALMSYNLTREIMLGILRGTKDAKQEIVFLEPKAGDILLIKNTGEITQSSFTPQERYSKYQNRWAKQQAGGLWGQYEDDWYYGHSTKDSRTITVPVTTVTTVDTAPALPTLTTWPAARTQVTQSETEVWYTEYLHNYAFAAGYLAEDIDELRAKGFRYDEIEDALYNSKVLELLGK